MKKVPTSVSNPLLTPDKTPTVWISLHIVSHLLHSIHLSWFLTIDLVELSSGAVDCSPLNLIFLTPKSAAIDCNSQFPFFSQTKQSWGWSDNNNSTTRLRALIASLVLVWTFIPSFANVPQAGTKPLPAVTMHTRQDAHWFTTFTSSIWRWQRVGIFIFNFFAASNIVEPLGTDTDLLFIVKLIELINIPPKMIYLLIIALNLQLLIQAPHFKHLVVSISCFSLGFPLIQPAGHTFEHLVQPLQSSVII